jgi:DNA modification methylase
MKLKDRIKEFRRVPAHELQPNPKNWRTHPTAQQDALRGVLAEVGIAGAVLARETAEGGLMLIDGHLRTDVMHDQEIPVLVLDVDEAEADKLLATIDPLAAMAEADAGKLDELLREIDTGSEALQEMLAKLAEDAGVLDGLDAKEIVEDEVPEPPVDPITKPGDLWVLGDHRLLCGDSTKAEDVGRLMAGQTAGGIVTDPPYGIGIDGQKESVCKNPKHNRKAHAFMGWDSERPSKTLFESLVAMRCPAAIFGGNYFADMLPASRGWIYWSKGQDGLDMSDGELAWTSTDKPLRCVTVNRAALHGSVHPTQKPVEVIAFAIQYVEAASGPIYDPFLGSGTTLIAAEQLGRKCYGMEISPQYCDVIVKRWETLTGRKAVRDDQPSK